MTQSQWQNAPIITPPPNPEQVNLSLIHPGLNHNHIMHPSQRITTWNRYSCLMPHHPDSRKSKAPSNVSSNCCHSTFNLRSVKQSAVASSSEKCGRRSLVEPSDRQARTKLFIWKRKLTYIEESKSGCSISVSVLCKFSLIGKVL